MPGASSESLHASPSGRRRPAAEVDDERRREQRLKQISYGYNTPGFANMERLVQADPALANGGILPLQPPGVDLDVTKRTWDVLVRKWRRALHMFDHVFIDGVDDGVTTAAEVIEAQRRSWLREENIGKPRAQRTRLSLEQLLSVRDGGNVPKALPIDPELSRVLRVGACSPSTTSFSAVVQQSSPLHAATLNKVATSTSITPTNYGVKLFVSSTGAEAICPTRWAFK
jgi:hypothetical protein